MIKRKNIFINIIEIFNNQNNKELLLNFVDEIIIIIKYKYNYKLINNYNNNYIMLILTDITEKRKLIAEKEKKNMYLK